MNTFTKIFIHNIDFAVTKEGILRTFAQFGRIDKINMPMNPRNQKPRGLAFVIFSAHREAYMALEAGRKGITLGYRKLRVEVYKPLEKLKMEKIEKK